LQQHLHRLVLQCCLSSGGAGAVRHTETEVCALAAAAAGLCRAGGNPEVSCTPSLPASAAGGAGLQCKLRG
jgi:hypothetical protein